MKTWKDYLEAIYFDPKHPGSFTGPDKLYKVVKAEGKFKIGRYRIKKWLQDQESYSLTKDIRRKFQRARVVVEGLDSLWDVDIMDMASLSDKNDGIKYQMVAIDIFSRFGWCIPMKNKTSSETVHAFQKLLKGPRRPKLIRTDKGKEFQNTAVNHYLQKLEIHHFVSQNTETKANYAERFIKTIKHKIFRYLMKQRTQRYVDVLDDIISSYSHTVHQSLGRPPASVNKENESESRFEQYLLRKKGNKQTKGKRKRFKFTIGQTVRLSHIRHIFDRQYSQKWTGELFRIKSRFWRDGTDMYKLEEYSGGFVIKGSFYSSEIQPVNVDALTEFSIEKILRRRTRNNVKEVLVRWLHWPKKYDSWIPAEDVKDYS